MKQQRLDEANTTPQSSVLIRKFLALAAEIYDKELTPLMVAGYERALGSIPPKTLGPALLNTLRNEKFWPTPGCITEALGDLASERATLRSLPSGCVSDEGKTWKLLKGCAECDGSTWRRVTLVHTSHRQTLRGCHALRLPDRRRRFEQANRQCMAGGRSRSGARGSYLSTAPMGLLLLGSSAVEWLRGWREEDALIAELEKELPRMSRWYEVAMVRLEEELARGEITKEQFREQIRELWLDLRAEAEEEALNARRDVMGDYY